MSNQKSEPLSSSSPILSIDFRSGSVEMQLGNVVYRGELPMNSADRSQCNTASGLCRLEKINSEQLLANEG